MPSNFCNKLPDLISSGEPVIIFESPLQERYRMIRYISNFCSKIDKKCYLWNLGQETIKEVKFINNLDIVFKAVEDYIPSPMQELKDQFKILKFWEFFQGEGILIIENLYPWISANVAQETQFFLLSEWIKSNLLNLSFSKPATGKIKCAIL